MCPYDSCRLLAINLYGYVENPFTNEAYLDVDKLKQHVIYAQRIMDDIVDLELEKVAKIIEKIENNNEPEEIKYTELTLWKKIYNMGKNGRRTGLGITAEGDMLAALGFTYGTPDATEFATYVQKTIAQESYRSSCIMAKERGTFPVYDPEKEKNSVFIKRLVDSDPTLKDYLVYGRRNIANLTIAPTGSTSLLTQTTSGIEPVFLPIYKRRRKVNPNEDGVTVDFIDDNGDCFEEYIVFHHHFKTWMKVNGYDVNKKYTTSELNELVKQSPYHKATSNDVDWVEKVRMQGNMQKWIDHSISVTVNLPSDTTVETVSKVYMTAWESGCKGCTVYRDGSRGGVLISIDDKKKDEKTSFKRPKKLNAEIVRFQNNKEKWVAFVGLNDGSPYEIFTGRASEIDIPASINKGFIVKTKKDGSSIYNFEYLLDGKIQTMNGLSKRFKPEYWNYAKLISGMLRHGMPTQYAVKTISSLTEENDNINSWKNGVARVLKRFVKDGTVATDKCPNCGGKLIYQEGCLICQECGSSRCG